MARNNNTRRKHKSLLSSSHKNTVIAYIWNLGRLFFFVWRGGGVGDGRGFYLGLSHMHPLDEFMEREREREKKKKKKKKKKGRYDLKV